jgi:hypothetical protein
MMNPLRRRSFVLIASTVIVGALGYAWYGSGRAADQAGDQSAAPFGIATHQLFVTVENKAATSLFDITVEIVPTSKTIYTNSIGRMDNGERRELSLGDFRGRDGTPFTLRVAKPKTVRVSGKDMSGKVYTAEVPWE